MSTHNIQQKESLLVGGALEVAKSCEHDRGAVYTARTNSLAKDILYLSIFDI